MNWINRICDLESLKTEDLEQISKAMYYFGGTPDFIFFDNWRCVVLNYVDCDPIYGDWVNEFTWFPNDTYTVSASHTQ
jgi:hypothetical protein